MLASRYGYHAIRLVSPKPSVVSSRSANSRQAESEQPDDGEPSPGMGELGMQSSGSSRVM